ncbi:MAG: Crp/Fnr family transcriptional regulator [Methylobacteriaceae bacterium]|nr:Crp/Fnr family transcriptional regulator [Methylobacteriaceae bacterium]
MFENPLNRLIRRLEVDTTALSQAEKDAILRLPMTIKEVGADQDIVREGDRPTQCCVVVEGFQCRYKMLLDGGRQILSFHVPGDMPDLQSLFLSTMDHSLGTLTPNRVALISHDALRELIRVQPALAERFWRESLIDAAIFREWITNVGSRDAYARLAHVICEFYVRLRAVGLTKDATFDFPITQTELADATGLSTVHVNRSIQQIRANGLIIWERGACTIPNLAALKEAAMFEPNYLHMREGNAAA